MNALELRRRTLGKGVYKKTVEGNPAIAQGSLARRYLGITMQGWTEQDSTTGTQLFDSSKLKDISGFYVDEEGFIFQEAYNSGATKTLKELIPSIEVGKTYYLSAENQNDFSGFFSLSSPWYKNKTFIPEEEDLNKAVTVVGKAGGNARYRLMINEGSTAIPYEPYTGGQPSPNPDYPQEITSAGKYDEGTGKYQYTIKISDSEESPTKSQTVTLTSDRPLTKWDKLEKRDGVWGWTYKSAEIALDGSEDEAWTLYTTSATRVISFYTTLYGGIGAMKSSLCDKYINKNYAWNEGSLYGIYTDDTSYSGRKYFRPPSAEIETVEQWKTWLSENPLTVWYETDEETFVPLSESEQEQMNALYTFRPTTVLSNDCKCEMTLTYKTKKSLEVTT